MARAFPPPDRAVGSARAHLVYDVCMISERMQILLTPEQRQRLEEESQRQGRSVASLVREAIDARFGTISREARLAAAKAIAAMAAVPGGGHLTPQEINRVVDEEREEFFDRP